MPGGSAGAQRIKPVTRRSEHPEVLRLVCEAGAWVDAKDIAGGVEGFGWGGSAVVLSWRWCAAGRGGAGRDGAGRRGVGKGGAGNAPMDLIAWRILS